MVEGAGICPHLLADIFSRTRDQLVLIEVTSGAHGIAREKERKLVNWAQKKQANITAASSLTVYGVVMAPMDNSSRSSNEVDRQVIVVRGDEVRRLLGGLHQVFWWMVAGSLQRPEYTI